MSNDLNKIGKLCGYVYTYVQCEDKGGTDEVEI